MLVLKTFVKTRLWASLAAMLIVVAAVAPTNAALALEPPAVTAAGVYSYDLETGIVLYSHNENERMQVGSTVKVATALVVMAYGDTADEVEIIEEDTVDITVYSNMQLQAGDTLTVGTMLYGLLLPSGNDGAQALARHVGSQMCECDDRNVAMSTFVDAMNAYAADLGLTDTKFMNPVGTDDQGAYSTAHDIAILFGELMKNERLAGIVSESAYSFYSVGANPRNYQGQTTNRLLGQMGVIGGKTGTTEDAGGCVVLARAMNGGESTVITSVIGADIQYGDDGLLVEGSDKRWDDATAVLNAMDEQFAWVVPGEEGTFEGLGDELGVWQVHLQEATAIPYPTDGVDTAYQLVLSQPGGDGVVNLFYDQQLVGSVPVTGTTSQQAGDIHQ